MSVRHVEDEAEMNQPMVSDHVGRLTRKGGRLAQFLAWTLLGGPPCYVCGPWLVLRRFGSSGGPVDPRERVWFVERVLLRIDDMSPCLWVAFLLMWDYLVGHLILVRSYAFCLELRSVFPCSWGVFSPLFHMYTNIYQHSWKWSVINLLPLCWCLYFMCLCRSWRPKFGT